MNDDNLEVKSESISNSIISLTNNIKSLQNSFTFPTDFIDEIKNSLNNSMPDLNEIRKLTAPIQSIQISGLTSSTIQLVSQLSKTEFSLILDVIKSNKSIFQELQASFAILNTSDVLKNPSLISFNPTFDNMLTKNRNETETSKYNGSNFNSNEFEQNIVKQKPDEKVSEMTADLNSKIEKLDKGFFHGFITPFSTKEEFGRYVSQEILNILFNLIMTYAITVSVIEANKIIKIIFISIKNRFNF